MSNHSFIDFETSIEDKSQWTGAMKATAHVGNFVADDGTIKHMKIEYTPRVYHILDELILNVADQHIKHGVIECRVNLINDGSVEVTNIGQGFPIQFHADAKMWDPFIMSAIPNQGSKHDNIRKHLPTGGVNGIGLKICTRSCVWLEIHTIDRNTRRYYRIRYEHKGHDWIMKRPQAQILDATMRTLENLPFHFEEKIIELGDDTHAVDIGGKTMNISATRPFTTIRYMPRYEYYGMKSTIGLFRAYKTRLYEIATYMDAPIYINDSLVPVKSLTDYMKLVDPDAKSYHVDVVDPEGINGFNKWPYEQRAKLFYGDVAPHYPLQVGVIVSNRANSIPRWACINGVIVVNGSCVVFTHFMSQIEVYFAKKVKENLTSMVRSMISLYIVGPIPSPGWNGQGKFNFTLPEKFMAPYVISQRMLDEICATLKNVIAEQQKIDAITDIHKEMVKRPKVRAEKMLMSPLSKLGVPWAKRQSVNLFLVEGDSAANYVTQGTAAKNSCFKPDHISMYIMGGVAMNAREEFIEHEGKRLPTMRLLGYNVWNEIMHMVGLHYGCTYETEAEQQTLLVGRIIILTDQDVDGEGNITSLIVNFIDTFFPALIKSGRIFRMTTELIRVFDRNTCVAAFHNECDYRDWALANNYYSMITNDIFKLVDTIRENNPEVVANAMKIVGDNDPEKFVVAYIRNYISRTNKPTKLRYEYYKGLASHGTDFSQQAFIRENFLKNIVRFVYDVDARKTFEDFFKSDSTPRKIVLRQGMPERVIPVGGDLSCSDLLRGPLVIYSLEDMRRKLSGQYDGLNDVKRRILYAILMTMVKGRVYKFDNLVGVISAAGHYHHGNEVLESAMKNCGAAYFGSRRIPFFISDCHFGSRSTPKPAAARYLKARMNHEGLAHLYPKRDIDILPHRVEDGEVSVVTYFCSTIPPLFETDVLPSHGWCINTHAMSIDSLINITRALIDGNYDPAVHKLRIDTNGWRGKIITVAGRKMSVGCFQLDGNLVTVTELPFLKDVVSYQRQLVNTASDQTDETKEAVYDGTVHPFIANWGQNAIEIKESNGIRLDPKEIYIRFRVKPEVIESLTKAKIDDVDLEPALAFAKNIGLVTYISQQLNFMDPKDRVIEFKNYTEIIHAWFPMRKRLYVEHVERQIILLTFERAYLIELDRAIDENIIDALRNQSEEFAIDILTERKYFRFATAIINNPSKYTTDSLCMYISGFLTLDAFIRAWEKRDPTIDTVNLTDDAAGDISHNYIMRANMYDALETKRNERRKRIEAINRLLDEQRSDDMWRKMWLDDIDALDATCKKYLPRLWTNASMN